MTFVVPFDTSTLSRAALARASTVATALGEQVVALTVDSRDNEHYARDSEWLATDERFDRAAVVGTSTTRSIGSPAADVRHTTTDRWTSPGQVASVVRDVAMTSGRRSCSSAARTPAGWSRR